jgi:2-polyprenyl-3-methyl-5-hydroxy-6-metoxy-1,4-benzoquinol methylase
MCRTSISRQDALTERLFQSTIHAMELYNIYLGKELDLYRVLHEKGPLAAGELAAEAGIHERYAREWLEQQAVAGFLDVDDVDRIPEKRCYSVPEEHVGVLVHEEHAAHVSPFAQMVVGAARTLPDVVAAYRTGGGVPWHRFANELRKGQGAINRPAFVSDLTGKWLPAIPDLHARLSSSDGVRVADVGCGEGWSTIALARAYPNAEVVGFDLDQTAIETARTRAAELGVEVRFEGRDAATIQGEPFDVILILETLHDLSKPVDVLAALKRTLRPGGTVIIADERVAESFFAPGDELERMMYGWSTVVCLPGSMSEQPSAAIGTAIRPETVKKCASQAGFASCEILPIDNELFRFYRLL